jgi:hypothetical protein
MKQASLFSSSVQGGGKRREDGMSLSLKREEASVTASLPVITLRHITARGPYLATLATVARSFKLAARARSRHPLRRGRRPTVAQDGPQRAGVGLAPRPENAQAMADSPRYRGGAERRVVSQFEIDRTKI